MTMFHPGKMFRRAAALLLVLCIFAALCSCSKDEAENVESDAPPEETVSPSPEITPTPTPVYESVMIGTVVNVSTFLNVRSGPGTEYDAVGRAENGDQFKVLLKFVDGGYWHKIEYGDGVAYVHSDYLDVQTELVEVTD